MYLFEKCAWKTLRSGSFNQSIQLSTSGNRGRPPRDVGYRRMRIEIVPVADLIFNSIATHVLSSSLARRSP